MGLQAPYAFASRSLLLSLPANLTTESTPPMAARPRFRAAHWIVLLLVAAPVWKVVERFWRPGPRVVSAATRAAGRELFDHEWRPGDPLARGDGLGPVFNAHSCVECHRQGGAGGGGPLENNVTVYGLATADTHGIPRAGVVHQQAISPSFQERLDQVHKVLPHAPSIPLGELTDRKRPVLSEVVVTQRNTPALFGDGLIDAVPDDTLVAQERAHSTAARIAGLSSARDAKVRGRVSRLADGRIGRFGWKLEFASLNDFVKAACANELGLANPNQPQATPLGQLAYKGKGEDLTDEQCGLMADFIRALPAPSEVAPTESHESTLARTGRTLFQSIGCADCHTESVGPAVGIYSDLLLHDMGIDLEATTGYRQSDCNVLLPAPNVRNDKFAASQQPTPAEWRTAPLWGVADSAPYLHDGRAATLEAAIELHGGEAVDVTATFQALPPDQRAALVAFLKTLRAPSS
jgi:CxxC motif-containing protein (DUF1111 family)